jgi:hypothetical protein
MSFKENHLKRQMIQGVKEDTSIKPEANKCANFTTSYISPSDQQTPHFNHGFE